MIAEIIVLGSAAFGAAFFLAWLVRPDLRAWLEEPKHSFHTNVRRYDQSAMGTVVSGLSRNGNDDTRE